MTLRSSLCCSSVAALMISTAWAATPQEELKSFSSLGDVKIEELAKGKIEQHSQTNLGLDRALALESVYVIKAPMDVVLSRSLSWDPSRGRGTNVLAHAEFASATPATFSSISSLNAGPFKNLLKLTEGLPKPNSLLNLSKAEADSYAGNPREFWINVLTKRAQAFASGGIGAMAAYDGGANTIKPGDDLRSLLRAQGKIQKQFSGILGSSGMQGGGKASNYWELIDVEGLGAFLLGAYYSAKSEGTARTLDIQYYVSGGYYAMLIMHQMWPIEVDGQPATLVWRGDLISSASLDGLRGVERVGSGRAMRREIEKTIETFRKDAQK